MANRIVLNETSYHGAGARYEMLTEIKRRGLSKAFFMTDKDLVKFGVAKEVEKILEGAGMPYQVFDDIKANPTIENVQAGVDKFNSSGADFIIALGGGSVIDTAKGVGIIAKNPSFYDVKSLEGVADTKNRSVLIMALPTTAGTAAEVTINYVITDAAEKRKMVCVDPNDVPEIAFVDPELMYTMPKSLTAATGLDALTHAIESYITKGAWEMSNMFSIKAIELIHAHLEKAVNHPASKADREGMALAQYIAGMGFSNVGLGIAHSMAHPLSAVYDTPHGVACSLLLPFVMEYNAVSAAAPKYRGIAKAMGVNTELLNEQECIDAAIKAVKSLSVSINIPQRLNEIGVKKEDIAMLAKAAFADVCTGGNPRDTSVAEIEALYYTAF
ncbi:lactaldehyde reductase [Chitinophaga sancti]|uniref:Lactaldehyde reductase n=1 Tax=Chitinophaga sancti TaxID=1004 RepID=A0A1K1SLU8_9BACT|nr:lactaldehyde reductase [Chitinophaga sancti]WQD63855.1 lactaldehyde reductase [Chitinophaga sancti]WQG90520.1 lactaldehyde reductase [Chitinophaga sancti]SFW85164.1 lactaldehyde reductase [Chitinophaga sancti]